MEDERLERWRLILGRQADPEGAIGLGRTATGMDKVLEALYDSDREGGLGSSSPRVNRWLGDIRRYFPTTVVRLMQQDALRRLKLERMLLEPELLESVEPDVDLVAAILNLKNALSDETRASARIVVRRVVEKLEKELRFPMQRAIRGSLDRSLPNLRPRLNEINWQRTIRANLKHYQPEYKAIIPERIYGYGRRRSQMKDIIILADQSGSMSASVVHAGILSCIMASIRALRTRFIAFDSSVADLSEHLEDPVDLLFATQLGGGTDIGKALSYARPLIGRPQDTVVVLISDLYDGGREGEMLRQIHAMKTAGCTVVVLLALNDKGKPSYSKQAAIDLATLEIPAFACTPDQFPRLMAAALQNQSIDSWIAEEGIQPAV